VNASNENIGLTYKLPQLNNLELTNLELLSPFPQSSLQGRGEYSERKFSVNFIDNSTY
jgi:hypothetical protein